MPSKNIIDVLSALKESEWEMQQLKDCLIKSEERKRPNRHTVITFGTESVNTSQVFSNSGKVGVVIWIDKKALARELES